MSDSKLPSYSMFRLWVLKALEDGEEHSVPDICDRVADLMDLSEAQKNQELSGGRLALQDRINWARHYLAPAGLIDRPKKRGISQITEEGRQFLRKVLEEGLDRLTHKLLRDRCPEFGAWWQARKSGAEQTDPTDGGEDSPEDLSLWSEVRLERVSSEIQRRQEEKADELLDRLRNVNPASFEHIVIRLLQAMGYGRGNADWAEGTGGPGDGGIDGMIKEDALGLNQIYIQAKRYGERNTVGPEVVQQFVGALDSKGRGAKGVFVTTSSFTRKAREEADKKNHIAWIDGEDFVRLMIQYQVGVVCRKFHVVEKIDEKYFSEERQ